MGGKHEKGEIDKKKSRQPQKFSWDNVPEDDTDKLISFLKDEFDIDWADDAEITKSDDGMTIRISADEHLAEIIMDDKKKKAILKICDGKTHKLKVKEEDGKLNLYFSSIYTRVVKTLLEILDPKEFIKRISKEHPGMALFLLIVFVLAIIFGEPIYNSFVAIKVEKWLHESFGQKEDIIKPTKLLYNLTKGDEYIHIWEPCKNSRAPEKGWLVLENSFYNISINLDSSYYMIFDKKRNKDILVYDDTVKAGSTTLTGCDLGFGDNDLSNPIHYATTAIHDTDGIEYEIVHKDTNKGFVLIDTEGWDTVQKDAEVGYDVEAEVLFGIFANKPYFINAVELSNLQRMGHDPNPIKNPDEIVQSWVLIDEYRYTCMKGGDNTYADMWGLPLLYNATDISRTGRKPWHVGSAAFSRMFPEHILLGKRDCCGIIFSLPNGTFRFDDSLGAYGDQIAGEFIIRVDKPQKATVFLVNPVNERLFFYDIKDFNTFECYKDLMKDICEKYDLEYPNEPLYAHNWTTKRYAYVITLTGQWYDEDTDQVSDEIWTLADQGLEDFDSYQKVISKKMEETTPLLSIRNISASFVYLTLFLA
jgi:hypothetical protein